MQPEKSAITGISTFIKGITCGLMTHLTLHHFDLREPTFFCLSALSGSKENKANWNCVHVF